MKKIFLIIIILLILYIIYTFSCKENFIQNNNGSRRQIHGYPRSCRNINNTFVCDLNPGCFWQGNKCYPNSSGDDKMMCKDFKSLERCQINKCIWTDDNKCADINYIKQKINNLETENDNTENDNTENDNTENDNTENNKYEIKNVNCLSINNSPNKDKLNECLYNNCEWINERNLCVDKINKGCLIKNNRDCTDLKINYNPLLNRNKCKLIKDYNRNSKPICVDYEMKIPCKYYHISDCPTKYNPKVNLEGEIIEEPYCKLNRYTRKCVENDHEKEKEKESNSCMYNLLKDGNKVNNYSENCKEIEFNIIEDNVTKKVNMSVNKANLPCSSLSLDNCTHKKNVNMCNIVDGRCITNKDDKLLFEKINSIVGDLSLFNYNKITDQIGNIYSKQRSSNLCRLDEQIQGDVISINNNIIETNKNVDDISTLNNYIIFFVHLNIEDLIEILNIDVNKEQKIELEKFLENINIIIKSRFELKNILELKENNIMWISNKYKMTNINKINKQIYLAEKFNYKINSNPIVTKYGNIIIDKIDNICDNKFENPRTIRVPFTKFIKWFIPNPMSNLDDCLNDLKFKRLFR